MDARQMDRVISSLARLHPLQSVVLCFNEQSGIVGLMRFRAFLTQHTSITIQKHEEAVMLAVLMSREWGGTHNRLYHVSGLHRLSLAQGEQLRSILKDVDSVEASEHGAKDLLTRREKRRTAVAKTILDNVLTDVLMEEAHDWGGNISGCLSQLEDGTPALIFFLEVPGANGTTVTLDAFSGRMATDGVFGNELYINPGQLQKVIRTALEKTLEAVTA